jgi:proteasome accessory factor B
VKPKEGALSKRRTERLLSIVVLLLSSRRYLTAEQIRAAVSGYPDEQEAFKRMFERDKEELRDLGIPLETGRAASLDEEIGYRISRQDYELPEIHLEADEAAVLGIASRVWQSAELAGAATGAALKLRAASGDADADGDGDGTVSPALGIQPRLSTQEPAFGPLWEAVRDRRPVTFDYRAPGRSEVTRRTLEPWGVVNRRGRWYVAGFDRAREAPRVFRLSRIAGPVKLAGPAGSVKVPPGADVRELVKGWDKPPTREHTAVLRVRRGAGAALRRWGQVRPDPAPPGWDTLSIDYSDPDWYASYLASFGPDVVVIEPPELREAIIRRLKGALA